MKVNIYEDLKKLIKNNKWKTLSKMTNLMVKILVSSETKISITCTHFKIACLLIDEYV